MRKVHRRDVFFFPGYDIAGVGRYHRYLKRQCGWYARRFDASFEISALTPSPIEHWSIASMVIFFDWLISFTDKKVSFIVKQAKPDLTILAL